MWRARPGGPNHYQKEEEKEEGGGGQNGEKRKSACVGSMLHLLQLLEVEEKEKKKRTNGRKCLSDRSMYKVLSFFFFFVRLCFFTLFLSFIINTGAFGVFLRGYSAVRRNNTNICVGNSTWWPVSFMIPLKKEKKYIFFSELTFFFFTLLPFTCFCPQEVGCLFCRSRMWSCASRRFPSAHTHARTASLCKTKRCEASTS